MTSRTTIAAAAAAALMGTLAAPAIAQSKGDMTVGIGVHNVNPQGSSTTAAGEISVGDNTRPTLTFEYFVADKIGIEVLAAWPFEHDISLAGAGKIGKTKHLPPVISVQYHFVNNSTVTPFVGLGLNYTTFFDDVATGALAGARLDLDDSWGLAAHAGLDFKVSERSSLRLDMRYMDIGTDVKVNGAKIGKVDIDPLVIGAAYVYKF
ncbi:OmpW/AlkL family protein [Roseovarius aquimarinus]|uniref:OmpW family protein n=1 Tax=Roseovarius aquimarinus TaxID=1229156 RepID=A0ABW7I5S3_9RHOB